MNMPPPGPQGQPAAPGGQPPPGGPPGQPPQGQPQGGQNPIVQCIQILGQFIERLSQRDPAQGKAAAQHLQGLIEAIKGGGQKEGSPQEEAQESPQEEAQEPDAGKKMGAKKMGPMPMNAKPGAVQVL